MQIFAHYIAPLTNWLHIHPHWALFITFLVSFTESLAIIGSIIPGSVTMTAIGILAGSGVMPINLTFLAAILGAIAGDSASYALGYVYREKLANVWPFKRYPQWLILGKDYFSRHGGKSVLIGRFVGPLRSIIPVIAGMMGMQQWRFLVANVVSAIGWSIIYITPGILIGAASTELSAENASKLFIFILLALAGIWLVSLGLKKLLIKLNFLLQQNLHQFWIWSNTHPRVFALLRYLTPANETNHYPTALLFFLFIISSIISLILIITTANGTGITLLDSSVYLLLQSVRFNVLDVFFIFTNQCISYITLIVFFTSVVLWFLTHKNYIGFIYLSSILLVSIIAAFLISFIVPTIDLLLKTPDSNFLTFNLIFATSLFTFMIGYIKQTHKGLIPVIAQVTFINLLILAGLAAIYLGAYKFSDVLIAFFVGISSGIAHWLMYRRNKLILQHSPIPLLIIFLILLVSSSISFIINFKSSIYKYTPTLDKAVLNAYVWWNQQEPLLPLYRNNRIGNRISLFNLQYSGSLPYLSQKLIAHGWKNDTDSLITKLIKRTNGKLEDKSLPLLTQLFENRPPAIVMTYKHSNPEFVLVLRMWQSNYYMDSADNNIWIGSVHQDRPISLNKTDDISNIRINDPLTYLLPALQGFSLRQVNIPIKQLKPVAIPAMPTILLIKH